MNNLSLNVLGERLTFSEGKYPHQEIREQRTIPTEIRSQETKIKSQWPVKHS